MAADIDVCGISDLIAGADKFETLSAESKRTFFNNASGFCSAHSSDVNGGMDGGDCLWSNLLCLALDSLDDTSPDVRRAAGVFLGDLSRVFKAEVYVKSRARIFDRIESLVKDNESITLAAHADRENVPNNVMKSVSSNKRLDTWICCLENMAIGTGVDFCKEVDAELLRLVLRCLDCRDMYLEQDCMKLVHTMLKECTLYLHLKSSIANQEATSSENSTILSDEIAEALTTIILKGISSFSPGTRYQSCKAIREILSQEGDLEHANFKLVGNLLPALWYNRYSKENGLQQFCQETWVELTKGQGKSLIEAHLSPALEYCFQGLDGKSSADRINSCHCLSEVVRKLNQAVVGPRVGEIYAKLRSLAEQPDIDWQTLDASCLLIAEMVSSYPHQMECCVQELLQLSETIQSHPNMNVADSSALMLSRLVKHYGEKLNLKDILDGMGTCFRDFASQAKEFLPLRPLGGPSSAPTSLGAIIIERRETLQGTTHEIRRLGGQQEREISRVYGQFCLLVHLLPVIPQGHSSTMDILLDEARLVLEATDRPGLCDLSMLMLRRVPEMLEAAPRPRKKRLLDLLLERTIQMAKQGDNFQLREEALALLGAFERTFGKNVLRGRLAAIDKGFAEEFAGQQP